MSAEQPGATAAFDALLAGAETAAAKAASTPAEAPKTESNAKEKSEAPEPAGGAPVTILDPPVAAAASEKQPAGMRRHLPLAASIVLATAFGGLAGGTTVHLARDAAPPATEVRMAEATQALQDKMAELGADMTTVKTSLAVAQRNGSLQSGKLGERLERLEKAQAEPAAKLAKLAEAVERLERRPLAAATQPAPEVTGSVPESKQDPKPSYAEGWRLRDFYAGRAVVENQNGRYFEVGPGSTLPGLGRVDAIKREDGRVVVVTRNGLIAAAIEQRRAPMPYRYY